jgi:lipoate-protein ligase A
LSIQKWRFIDSGNNGGPENMALDEALLKSFDSNSSQPLLRLYSWSPPALSLGRFQKAVELLDLDLCRVKGVPVVRRITGGGAIFHADELTYSIVCAPHQIPASNSIKDSFRVLTGFLLQFYNNLGLDASYAVENHANGEKLGERTPFCFAGKESYDILINGRKIGGNAQRRMKQVIFQHGSIPLIGRIGDGIQFLRLRPLGIEERVTCLTDEGVKMDSELLKARLMDAFSGSLNAVLVDDSPTSAEQELSAHLKSNKYLNDNWNLQGEGV